MVKLACSAIIFDVTAASITPPSLGVIENIPVLYFTPPYGKSQINQKISLNIKVFSTTPDVL
jgi:hypothetical protein